MFKLGDVVKIQEMIDKPINDRRAYNKQINDVFQSLIVKVQKAQRMKGKPYIFRDELEPHLTQEEIDFIGPYWKSRKLSDGSRVQYTKSYSLQKILLRKFSVANPDWKKEKLGDTAAVKYLRMG